MESIFRKRGINIEKIEALENKAYNLSRKDENLNWFSARGIHENLVIINNDKSLHSLPPFLKKSLILTGPVIGLTEEHLENIKAILNKDLQFA